MITARLALIALTLCLLASCMSSQEDKIARNSQRAAEQIETNKEKYCTKMGAPPDSDKYTACRQWIEQQLANETAKQREDELKADQLGQNIEQGGRELGGGKATRGRGR